MIRRKHYISGRGTRYFSNSSGIVMEKRSAFITFFIPLILMMVCLGFGSYFGFQYYQEHVPSLLSSDSTEEVKQKDKQESAYELEPFQAREDEFLASQIKNIVEDLPGTPKKWSVSVRDLNSGRMANINADKQFDLGGAASLFLFPSLEKRLSADYWQSYIDYSHSVNECVTNMISKDDDSCSTAFGYYLGWNKYDEYNHEIGFKDTLIKADKKTSTARDVSEMMYRLQNSQILSDKARRLAFDGFYDQQSSNGIKNVCDNCLVGSLVTERDNLKHEVAVVTHGSSKYVVAIMSQDAQWQDFEKLARGIDREMNP